MLGYLNFASGLYTYFDYNQMPSSTIAGTSALALTALLLSSRSTASAQLLGCDAVGCPVDEYRRANCEVGNATLNAVGIANVTTSLSREPLTWTLGLQEVDNNGTAPSFDRNYYLGTPPSLKLDDTTGCALFFEGVSANLTAPNADQLDNFTCSDSLAESCIADLTAQAHSTFKALNNGTATGPALCNQLRDSLANQAPSTCNGVRGSWGAIAAQRTSPSLSPPPLQNPSKKLTRTSPVQYPHIQPKMPRHNWQGLRPLAHLQQPQNSCQPGVQPAGPDSPSCHARDDGAGEG